MIWDEKYIVPTEGGEELAARLSKEQMEAFSAWREDFEYIVKNKPRERRELTILLLYMGGLTRVTAERQVMSGKVTASIKKLSWNAAWQVFRPGWDGVIPKLPSGREYVQAGKSVQPFRKIGDVELGEEKKRKAGRPRRRDAELAKPLEMYDPAIHLKEEWSLQQRVAWASRNLMNPDPDPAECTAEAWGLLSSARDSPWKLHDMEVKLAAGEETDEVSNKRHEDLMHAIDVCLESGSEALKEAADRNELEVLGLARNPMEEQV